jgi:hypothetical protein
VAPEIATDDTAPMFLISTRSQEQVSSGMKWGARGWTLFGLLSTCHALVTHSFNLLHLHLHLSIKLCLHLFLTIGNKLVCLCLELFKQLDSDAFSLFISIEGFAVVLKCLGNLLSLDFLFNLDLVSLVLLNCLFCSHPLYFHLLFW